MATLFVRRDCVWRGRDQISLQNSSTQGAGDAVLIVLLCRLVETGDMPSHGAVIMWVSSNTAHVTSWGLVEGLRSSKCVTQTHGEEECKRFFPDGRGDRWWWLLLLVCLGREGGSGQQGQHEKHTESWS